MYYLYIEEADDTANKVIQRKKRVSVFMAGQRLTRRQKDISRLLREKKYNPPQRSKKNNTFPSKKRGR